MRRPLLPLTLLCLIGCSSAPSTSNPGVHATVLQPPGDQTVAIGDRIQLAGTDYTLEISALHGDSRCAVDVTCVWEGEFAVTGTLRAAEGLGLPDVPVSLTTHDSVVAAGLTFRITGVEPAAHTGTTIPTADYRMMLRVEPTGGQ